MRLDPRETVPEVLPAFRGYHGRALGPVLGHGRCTDERIADCATEALARGDQEGLRLARVLMALTPVQRRRLKSLLTPASSVS